jgi:hypothetical protein
VDHRELRLLLLRNGYTPLPNRGKPPVLKDWPSIEVTPEMIAEWPETPTTGVRVDGSLLVIDIDVDAALADEILKNLPAALREKLDAAPERRSTASAYKRALFCRTAAKISRLSTGQWGDLGDKTGHTVEVFGSGSPRQFGVYGAHTVEGVRPVHHYVWLNPARDLRTTPLAELPELDEDDVTALLETARQVFRNAGLAPTKSSIAHAGQPLSETMRDLSPDTEIEVASVHKLDTIREGVYTIREFEEVLIEIAAATENFPFGEIVARCAGDTITGHGDNPTRIGLGLDRDWRMFAHDFEDGRRHKPAFPPTHVAVAFERIRPADIPPAEGSDAAPSDGGLPPAADALQAAVHRLHEEYVLYEAEGMVLPRRGRRPAVHWRNKSVASELIEVPTVQSNGKLKAERYNVFDMWLRWPHKTVVHGYTFDPATDARIIERDGLTYYNLYEPVERPDEDDPEAVKLFELLLSHLVPDKDERDWFRNWIAAKVQHQEQPLAGVIHYAPFEGCGRNTLFNVLQLVLGQDYCMPIIIQQLRGLDGQSAYTDWLEGKLLIFIPEVTIQPPKYNSSRANMLDKIKSYIDPSRPKVQIIKKYQRTYSVRTTASFFLATNSVAAVEFSDNDRRFTVLRGPDSGKLNEQPWASGLFDRLEDMNSPTAARFGATLWRYLRALDVDLNAARTALPTATKEGMRRAAYASRAENLDLLDLVYDKLDEYKYVTVEQVAGIVHEVAVGSFMEGAAAQRLINAVLDALHARAVGNWVPMYTRGENGLKLKVTLPNGVRRSVRCFANGPDAAAELRAANESERAKMLGMDKAHKVAGFV